MGTIVEEATKISNRRGKSIEEERREAEEKVTWISSTVDLDLLNSEKKLYSISSGGEAGHVYEGKQSHLSQ